MNGPEDDLRDDGPADVRDWTPFDEALRRGLREHTVVERAPHEAYERLQRRLDADDDRGSPRLRGLWTRLRERAAPRWIVVAQAAAIAMLAVGWLLHARDATAPLEYRTLSTSRTSVPEAGNVALRLVVDDAMSAAELRRLLVAERARIVDGPTALGVFTIVVAIDVAADDAGAHAMSLAMRLRERPGVRFAEPVTVPPGDG